MSWKSLLFFKVHLCMLVEWKREESVKIMAPEMPFYRYQIAKKLKRTVMRSSGFSNLLKLNVKINGLFLK